MVYLEIHTKDYLYVFLTNFIHLRTRSIDAQVQANQVVTLLGSLPRHFATLVTATEARVEDVSLDYVQQALIHEDMKQS